MDAEKQMPLEETAPEEVKETVKEKKPFSWKKFWIVIGSIVAGAAVLCATVCAVAAGNQKILDKTTVLGMDMSGMTREQAMKHWEEASADVYKTATIQVTVDGKDPVEVTLEELGVKISAEEAVNAAWDEGRDGNFVTNGYALARSWVTGTDVTPAVENVTADMLKKGVESLKKKLDIPATDSTYRIDPEKTEVFYLTRAADGRSISAEKLTAALIDTLKKGDMNTVDCTSEKVAAKELDLAELQKKLAGSAKNAWYDVSTGECVEGKPSVEFDAKQAQQLMEQAKPGEEFEVPCKLVAPKVDKADLEAHLFTDLLGTYTTYAGGSWGRLMNVSKATSMVNGAVLNTGDQFSYLDTIGYQSAETGWYPAPGYQGGKTVDMYGGGVCQVSSTLYYATLLANLKIVTRYCHQFAPSYITWGCDATVSEGAVDFVFENDRDYPIKIVASDVGNAITISIYGTKVDDYHVEMVSETLGVTHYKTVEKKTDKLAAGKRQVEQTPYTGYYVKTWRYIYDGDGNLISSDLEAVSDYEARDEIILVGTKEVAKPADSKPASSETKQETKQETKKETTPAETKPADSSQNENANETENNTPPVEETPN